MKSAIYKFIFGCSALAIAATACNSDEQLSLSGDRTAANISAGVGYSADNRATRAADAAWGINDHIGITMLASPLPAQTAGQAPVGVVSGYSNQDYVTTAGDGKFTPASVDKILYYPLDGSAVTYKAYYPYTASLPANFVKPVDVTSQADLAAIDLMTAVHTNGSNSKDHPDVNLKFYHRLTKAVINLTADSPIDLTGCKLVVKGLKTQGAYDLMGDNLSVNESSGADIQIPLKSNSGSAILLPRAAGNGVVFEVTTANGGVYTAMMDAALEFKGGFKYTFNITLKTTPITVSATIEPWAEGTENSMDVVRLVTGLGDNADFNDNDEIMLYLKDTKTATGADITNPQFALGTTFKYHASSDIWVPESFLYWENIYGDPVDFRGTSVMAAKLNSTQMDDILISDNTTVNQYKGVNLVMKHAGSKLTVLLKSSDGTFSAADLAGAAITLPSYLNSGTLDAKTGAFTIGTTTGNITPQDGVAIFPPQTVTGNVVIVSVNGRTYEVPAASGGFVYAKGTAYKMTLDLKKAKVEVSTVVADWTTQDIPEKVVTIGTSMPGTNSGDLQNGDQLYLYTTAGAVPGYFTYDGTAANWNYNGGKLYWEDIPATGNIYASITRPEISTGKNQSMDYITATPVVNNGGVGNSGLTLQLFHRVAKVQVNLTSDGSYTTTDLQNATLVLPDYAVGGKMENGIYIPGTDAGNIGLDNIPNAVAYLQPQTINAGATTLIVTVAGRPYNVIFDTKIEYKAGQKTILNIKINKAGLVPSVTVAGWTEDVQNLTLQFKTTTGSATGFGNGDLIKFYDLAAGSSVTGSNIYTYSGTSTSGTLASSTPWYRDDFNTGDKISAVFPASASSLASGNTFNWTCKNSDPTNAHQDDILVANNGVIASDNANVSLDFKHVLSKVTVNLFNGEGFTAADLANHTIALTGFKLGGTVNVATGTATATSAATSSFAPTKLGTANTVSGTTAVASYEAFIMPQTIGSVGTKTTIINVVLTLNGMTQTYPAQIEYYDFKAGENHVFNITLKKTGLIFTATVAPWQNGTGGSIVID